MSEWRFKLLYDGECPLCRREVRWMQRWNRRGHLAFEDISASGFNAAQHGITAEEAMAVIHGVFPDGRIVRRVEVFRQAYRAIGLGWVAAPTGWPGLRWVFDHLYTGFARNRISLGRLFGRTCGMGTCAVDSKRPAQVAKNFEAQDSNVEAQVPKTSAPGRNLEP